MRLHSAFAVLLAASSLALPAAAHPKLVEVSPAEGAIVAAPAAVTLKFNEKLVSSFTGADLVMTGMPGMAGHQPMKMAAKAALGGDGQTLVVTPDKPLAAGSYRVDWHAVAADTHRVKGAVAFSVR